MWLRDSLRVVMCTSKICMRLKIGQYHQYISIIGTLHFSIMSFAFVLHQILLLLKFITRSLDTSSIRYFQRDKLFLQ